MFFDTIKVDVNMPRLPRIPPQTHHEFTITEHHKISKTP